MMYILNRTVSSSKVPSAWAKFDSLILLNDKQQYHANASIIFEYLLTDMNGAKNWS
jgi:hypothetical protein